MHHLIDWLTAALVVREGIGTAVLLSAILAFVACYLLGSIPSGLIVARIFGLGDLKAIGSGSTGATNVVRAGGKLPGAVTLLADVAKGAVGLGFAGMVLFRAADLLGDMKHYGDDRVSSPILLAFLPTVIFAPLYATILGHCYSPWLRFRGGKGIAVLIGSYLAFDIFVMRAGFFPYPVMTPFYLVGWVVLFKATRISAIGGMGASLATLTLLVVIGFAGHLAFIVTLIYFLPATLFVIWRHRENIDRLLQGVENRFSGDGTKGAP